MPVRGLLLSDSGGAIHQLPDASCLCSQVGRLASLGGRRLPDLYPVVELTCRSLPAVPCPAVTALYRPTIGLSFGRSLAIQPLSDSSVAVCWPSLVRLSVSHARWPSIGHRHRCPAIILVAGTVCRVAVAVCPPLVWLLLFGAVIRPAQSLGHRPVQTGYHTDCPALLLSSNSSSSITIIFFILQRFTILRWLVRLPILILKLPPP